MRIISQRRDLSVDFESTPIYVNYNHILAIIGDKERVIGEYSTQERAMEVLQNIHETYSGLPVIFKNIEPDKSVNDLLREAKLNAVYTINADNADIFKLDNAIFKMPQG
jgi:hypothetical protein